MNGSAHRVRATILVLLVAVVVSPALGCAGETTGQAEQETVTGFPKGLQAVMGRTETDLATATSSAWRVTGAGVVLRELPSDYVLAVGESGSTIVYSDLQTGQLYLWHPGESSPDDISTVEVPTSGSVLNDVMALSPDESTLALVRSQSPPETPENAGTDNTVVNGWIINVESGRVDSWEWLDATVEGDVVTALHWYATSDSVYLSFGYKGGSQGERSYRYEPSTGRASELPGLAAVLDTGLQGQVLGLGAAARSGEFDYPPGSVDGLLPLVLWQGGQLVRLPRASTLATWDFAWVSDDGKTIVVRGSAAAVNGPTPCLEVLKLGDAGWKVSRLFDGGDSLSVVYGVGFEPNSDTFYFQGGSPPNTPAGAVTGSRLFALDTETGQVATCLELPGGEGANFVQTMGIVGTHQRGGTGCVEGDCP